jgi:phytoene dehydrogenase-like protein
VSFAGEVTLVRSFLTPEGRTNLGDDESADGILGAATGLLEEVAQRCTAATAAGALAEGRDIERALVLMSSVVVVLLVSTLSRWDETLFDGQRLAAELIRDLVGGWGAPPAQLSAAESLVRSFLADHTLAPRAGEA